MLQSLSLVQDVQCESWDRTVRKTINVTVLKIIKTVPFIVVNVILYYHICNSKAKIVYFECRLFFFYLLINFFKQSVHSSGMFFFLFFFIKLAWDNWIIHTFFFLIRFPGKQCYCLDEADVYVVFCLF